MTTGPEVPAAIELAAASADRAAAPPEAPRPGPRGGRPLLVPREEVLEHIRRLARREPGLFRVDHTHPMLYARARRLYGTWAAAVAAAGLDYRRAVADAMRLSIENRRRARRSSRARARRRA